MRIAESTDDDAVSSLLLIAGSWRDRQDPDCLVLACLPGFRAKRCWSTGHTVNGVARENAVTTARLLAAISEDMLAVDQENWVKPASPWISGGTTDEPEISYTVELGAVEDETGEKDDAKVAEVLESIRFHHPASTLKA